MRTIQALLLLVFTSASASIMPTDRMGPWRDCVGVPGGIPNSSNMTISATIDAGASLTTINNAIQAASSNQVVQLSAGTYNLGGRVVSKTGVVLRGAGMAETEINFTSGGVLFGTYDATYGALALDAGVTRVNWTAGYSQNTSNLTFSSTSGLSPGVVICLDQLDDTYYVNNVGFEGAAVASGHAATRHLEQWTEVQAVNGTTVTIWPPLAAPYWSGDLTPQAWWITPSSWVTMAGVENLTINSANSGGIAPWGASIMFELAKYCWAKNVKTTVGRNTHITGYGSLRCEIRHCYAYDTYYQAQQSYGYCPSYTSGWLVEDNILEKIVANLMCIECSSQCVFAYNYVTNAYFTGAGYLMGSGQSHDPHNYMMLFEGNHGGEFDWDFIHGSSSHFVAFRNRLTGWVPWTYGGGESLYNVLCEQIDPTNRFAASVGNLLGTAGKHTKLMSYPGDGAYGDNHVIYKVGFVNHAYDGRTPDTASWWDDTNAVTSFFRHMDYDVVTDGIYYNPTNADVTLPDSLYLSSKPSYFASLAWPPYNPTNTTAAAMSYTNIPAGYRAVYGTDPPAEGNSAPNITAEPTGQTNLVGQTCTFTVTATGTPTPNYTWYRAGTQVGTDSSAYTTPALQLAWNNQQVYCALTNSEGYDISATVYLGVTNAPSTATARAASGRTHTLIFR